MSNEFIAGRPCLDFANTVDWRASAQPEELLGGLGDLLAWSVRAGTLDERTAGGLQREARSRPDAGAAVFAQALELREAIHRIFRAEAHDERPDAADLALLAGSYTQALAKARLATDNGHYEWRFDDSAPELDRAWWPLALSAVELLESHELVHVRECGGRGCGWLFLDETRNHGRRWCVSSSCGNRERVRRYYARQAKAARA